MGIFKTVSANFIKKHIRLFSSWCWVRQDFVDDFEKLIPEQFAPDAAGNTLLWKTKQKYVFMRTADSGKVIVCKKYHKFRHPQHFITRPAPTGLEALNYQLLRTLGIPSAELLAAGETRFCFFPKEAFFITEFLENTCDGREFLPEGKYADNKDWKEEFCRKNLLNIAKFHDNKFLHKGFTPFNSLWREKDKEKQVPGDMLELFWIDVATCRYCKKGEKLLQGRAKDLALFFSFLCPREEERKELVHFYIENCTSLQSSFEEFFSLVEEYHKKILQRRIK